METCYNNRETSSEDESCRIMTVATMVREEIRASDYNTKDYPVIFELKNTAVHTFQPPCLHGFLRAFS